LQLIEITLEQVIGLNFFPTLLFKRAQWSEGNVGALNSNDLKNNLWRQPPSVAIKKPCQSGKAFFMTKNIIKQLNKTLRVRIKYSVYFLSTSKLAALFRG